MESLRSSSIQNPHPIQMSKNVASAVASAEAEKNVANDKRSRVHHNPGGGGPVRRSLGEGGTLPAQKE